MNCIISLYHLWSFWVLASSKNIDVLRRWSGNSNEQILCSSVLHWIALKPPIEFHIILYYILRSLSLRLATCVSTERKDFSVAEYNLVLTFWLRHLSHLCDSIIPAVYYDSVTLYFTWLATDSTSNDHYAITINSHGRKFNFLGESCYLMVTNFILYHVKLKYFVVSLFNVEFVQLVLRFPKVKVPLQVRPEWLWKSHSYSLLVAYLAFVFETISSREHGLSEVKQVVYLLSRQVR